MKIPRLTLIFATVVGSCYAQDLCSLATQARGFSGPLSADAYTVLDAIGNVVPFNTRTIRLWATANTLVKEKGGAAAQLCGTGSTERWIFFDPEYIESIKPSAGKSEIPRYFVLAHEAAHHINGDTLIGNTWTKDQELLVDHSAAVWLTRLGVTRDQLIGTFEALELPIISVNGYPTRAERRTSVIKGFDDGSKGSRLSVKTTNAQYDVAVSTNWTTVLWDREPVYGVADGSSIKLMTTIRNPPEQVGPVESLKCDHPYWTPEVVWSNPHRVEPE